MNYYVSGEITLVKPKMCPECNSELDHYACYYHCNTCGFHTTEREFNQKYLNETIEDSTELKSQFNNEEYVYDYNYEVNNNHFKIVIAKITDEDNIYYEYLIGKLDDNNNIIDWPLFESSDEFETMSLAQAAAEDYIFDYVNDSI